jgi:hypothetical protein
LIASAAIQERLARREDDTVPDAVKIGYSIAAVLSRCDMQMNDPTAASRTMIYMLVVNRAAKACSAREPTLKN